MPTLSLETIATEPPQHRNIARAGIHLTAFAAYGLGTTYALTENLDNPLVQLTLPALVVGQIAGLWAVQEVTSCLMDKVSAWYNR